MARILVDTNAFLEFYKTSDPSFLKHAAALAQFGRDVFVSRQLVDEVERNKLAVSADRLRDELKRIDFPKVSLPGLPDEIREEVVAAAKSAEDLKKRAQAHVRSYLCDVTRGCDTASMALRSLFARAVLHDEGDLSRARERRERGNPPGKSKDPLGDQLIWEQFIGQLEQPTHVWIVTKDGDYFVREHGELHLNPLLRRDLESKSPRVHVRVFDSIAVALQDYQKTLDVEPVLTPAESEQGRRVETELSNDDDEWFDDRTLCDLCDPGDERGPPLVSWSTSSDRSEEPFDRGTCDWCNGTSIRCHTCGAVTGIYESDEEKECDGGCGLTFRVVTEVERKGESWSRIEVVARSDD